MWLTLFLMGLCISYFVISRGINEKRFYPGLDINRSGTGGEDLLMEPEMLLKIWILRMLLHPMDEIAALPEHACNHQPESAAGTGDESNSS